MTVSWIIELIDLLADTALKVAPLIAEGPHPPVGDRRRQDPRRAEQGGVRDRGAPPPGRRGAEQSCRFVTLTARRAPAFMAPRHPRVP